MGEGNALLQRRENLSRDTALASAAAYMSLFGEEMDTGESRVEIIPASFEIVYMTGWAPDPKQARAAKRGSATVSFQELSSAMGEKNNKPEN